MHRWRTRATGRPTAVPLKVAEVVATAIRLRTCNGTANQLAAAVAANTIDSSAVLWSG
jgi:hypothetical protein